MEAHRRDLESGWRKMGTRYPGFPPAQAEEVDDVVNARGAALPAATPDPDIPLVATTATCKTPAVPLSKAKLTVPVWSPGDKAERSAAIEIDVLPGSNCPLPGDMLSQPIPFAVEIVAV